MITETVHAAGQYEIPLRRDTPPHLLKQLGRSWHIVITPQRINPKTYDDATILSIARYTGVHKRLSESDDGSYELWGKGLWDWLGDPAVNIGPAYRTTHDISAANLATTLSTLIPNLTAGTITEPGGTYTGFHDLGELPAEAVRTALVDLGAEMRINPDGTYDAGPAANVFNAGTPLYVATDRGGSDPNFRSVEIREASSAVDHEEEANRVAVIETTNGGVNSITGTAGATGPEFGIDGSAVDRSYITQVTTDTSVTPNNFASGELDNHATTYEFEVVTDQTELSLGSFRVGDAFYLYRPPTIYDLTNQINFRGEVIFPRIERLLTGAWPVSEWMGVYGRPPLVSVTGADYIDFSPFVDYEA